MFSIKEGSVEVSQGYANGSKHKGIQPISNEVYLFSCRCK